MPSEDSTPKPKLVSHESGFASSPWSDNRGFAERVKRVFAEEGVSFGEDAIYTPFVTLSAWLWQTLNRKSCRCAVMWLALHLGRLQDADDFDTGNYCRARAKLPERALRRLVTETACAAEEGAPAEWRWHGRNVFLVDGTTVSMPDTPDNQAEYPQPKTQKPGVGFPLMRMVLLLSLATAMVHDVAFGPYAGKESGETALLRSMLDSIPKNSILVADRYYCSYWMVALLAQANVDMVCRLHQCRNHDFRQGKSLGPGSRQIVWERPGRPDWMSEEVYATIPETLTLRLVRTAVSRPGFRVRELTVLTTLDAATYTTDDVTSLYHQRWHAELDIRSIKSTMHMEVLTCKSPANVRREALTCLLAYNLCREQAMCAAWSAGRCPREISLAASRDVLILHSHHPPCFLAAQLRSRLAAPPSLTGPLGGERIGHRPNRCEPRANKRRPKSQTYLNEHRDLARARLLRASPS